MCFTYTYIIGLPHMFDKSVYIVALKYFKTTLNAAEPFTFQVSLFPNGTIYFVYKEVIYIQNIQVAIWHLSIL